MDSIGYQAVGADSPLGDRHGTDEQWSPERVEEISNDEVKSPQTGNDVDEAAPDDPSSADNLRDGPP
jgi:hypothetical protein